MRALLALADTPDGSIEMKVIHEGPRGFEPSSNAHQHMRIIQRMMDAIAKRRETEGEHVVSISNLDATIQKALDDVEVEAKRIPDITDVLDDPPPADEPSLILPEHARR